MFPWLATLTVLLMLVMPLIAAVMVRRRFRAPWLFFFVGVGTFLAAQVVHLPLNAWLSKAGIINEGSSGIDLIWSSLLLGLTGGITEELARSAGFVVIKRVRRIPEALMIGLGHGGIETMLVAILIATGATEFWFLNRFEMLSPGLSPELVSAIRSNLSIMVDQPFVSLVLVLDRSFALVLHMGLSLIICRAIVKRELILILFAILYHATFDAVTTYFGYQLVSVWLLGALQIIMLVPLLLWARRMLGASDLGRLASKRATMVQLRLFGVAIGKEFLYQWRSKRMMIVLAVFAILGIISPLLAKFTPELLTSIEGAEQFAELIPEPVISDATNQYIRNITQFGFILAIILGMGAVAGEKEHGTAAMIMSKPLPRWAFIVSKLVSQVVVFVLGFILSAAFAYSYTYFLFGALPIGNFILINLLLILWMTVFVSITLLASTAGSTTGVAAGVAAIGSVSLLLAGNLPKFGALTPNGLVAWMSALAMGNEAMANGGALTMAFLMIILTSLAAIAAFERQEL